MSEKLRWGLLSTARINEALFKPLRSSKRSLLLAVASRSREKAEAYARKHRIPRAHGSYQALLDDPEIDVVYIPLPNHLHAEWTTRALQAGKHVLIEKPIALTLAEVDAIASAAQQAGRIAVEGFKFRSHPQMSRVKQLAADGKLGRLRLLRGSFTYDWKESDNYRMRPEMGGGCLWDVGCYLVNFARCLLETEPLEVFGWQTTSATGVDEAFAAQLRFPEGVFAQFDCSMALPYHSFMEIVGTEGTLVVPHPSGPGRREGLALTKAGKTEIIPVTGPEPFTGEVEDLAEAILTGRPPAVSLADSRLNTAALLALYESARTGKPVTLVTQPSKR
jgi:xylose dehydrogenase (NAD/NADP)